MKRRWIAVGLTLMFGLPMLSGCETLNQTIRRNSGDKPKSTGDDEKDEVEKVSSEAPKGFFSGNRLSGAMSSEGRDVERSLGVN
jgi:hypothetical protein